MGRRSRRSLLLLLLSALASACAPNGLTPGGRADRPRGVVILRGEPSCLYTVVSPIRARNDRGRGPAAELVAAARAVGAHAVLDARSVGEYDAYGRLVSVVWEGTAIRFSDPSNPDCYR